MSNTNSSATSKIWYLILLAGVGLWVYGAAMMVLKGHGEALNVTRGIPMGILISSYEFFVAAGAGLGVLAALGQGFGPGGFAFRSLKPFVSRALALSRMSRTSRRSYLKAPTRSACPGLGR